VFPDIRGVNKVKLHNRLPTAAFVTAPAVPTFASMRAPSQSKMNVTDPSILLVVFQPPWRKSMLTKSCYMLTTAVNEFTFYSRQLQGYRTNRATLSTKFGCFQADSHIACCAHVVPLPCRAAKGLECVSHLIYTVRPCLIHTCHAMPMPCSDHAVLLKATAQHGS
jgi:hypothetical protein